MPRHSILGKHNIIGFVPIVYMKQDELGIWTTPGAKVAWFKDSDGNILRISEFPELKK